MLDVAAFAREVALPEPQIDLGRAALVLAGVEYSNLDISAALAKIDRLAQILWSL